MLNEIQTLSPYIGLSKQKVNKKGIKLRAKELVIKPKGLEINIPAKNNTNVNPNGKVEKKIHLRKATNVKSNGKLFASKRTPLCSISNKTVISRNVSSHLNSGKRLIREMSTSASSIRNINKKEHNNRAFSTTVPKRS